MKLTIEYPISLTSIWSYSQLIFLETIILSMMKPTIIQHLILTSWSSIKENGIQKGLVDKRCKIIFPQYYWTCQRESFGYLHWYGSHFPSIELLTKNWMGILCFICCIIQPTQVQDT